MTFSMGSLPIYNPPGFHNPKQKENKNLKFFLFFYFLFLFLIKKITIYRVRCIVRLSVKGGRWGGLPVS